MRFFNTAGPCDPDIHHMLPPLERLPNLQTLIAQRGYFVIHAPRQTGKTTAMLALAQQLTASGQYTALMISAEVGAPFAQDVGAAEDVILQSLYEDAEDSLPAELCPPPLTDAKPGHKLRTALRNWAKASPRPIALFIDEIDSLADATLSSVLRQLRSGYPSRPRAFPQAIALIGLRDVRDYKIASGGSNRLSTASPFNVKLASLSLRNFTADEVAQLYQQHTEATGQPFTPQALDHAYALTQGQPWLVNALAKEVTENLVPDRAIAIDINNLSQAKEILIRRQDTHLDSLAERLKEPRIRTIIEPMLAGSELENIASEDIEFVVDLGLCRISELGGLEIANPIYREVLPRVLAQPSSASLPKIQPGWLTASGALDIDQLLDAFLAFWRQHGQPLLRTASYHEIAPHLVLMAFLDRVANGGGTIEREYAIGSDRLDLHLRYGDVTVAMELKVWRQGRPDPLEAGLEQLDRYLAGLGLASGWLVIFDQREGLAPIGDRTTTEMVQSPGGRRITVVRG